MEAWIAAAEAFNKHCEVCGVCSKEDPIKDDVVVYIEALCENGKILFENFVHLLNSSLADPAKED